MPVGGSVVMVTSHVGIFCFLYSSNQKNEEKRGGSGSNNWGGVKDEIRSVYFLTCMFFCEMVRSKHVDATLNGGGRGYFLD